MHMYTCISSMKQEVQSSFTQTATGPSCNNTSVRGMYAVTFVCTRPSVDRAPASHGETLLYPQCGCLNEDGRGGMWEKGRGGEEEGKRRGGREEGRREEGKRGGGRKGGGEEGGREEERKEEGNRGRGGRKGRGERREGPNCNWGKRSKPHT